MRSPENWKVDVGEDDQQVEMGDGGTPYDGVDITTPKGARTGETRSIYFRRSYSEKYGSSHGCAGCRDMATQRPGPSSGWAAHNPDCRRRLEEKIQQAEPERWAKHHLRRSPNGGNEDQPRSAEHVSTGGSWPYMIRRRRGSEEIREMTMRSSCAVQIGMTTREGRAQLPRLLTRPL